MTTAATERVATRGRPRSIDADVAILSASLEVLAEHGFRGLTVDAVASRAGVAKTTIYRRFVGREELLLAALTQLQDELPVVPESGSVRERVRVHLDGIRGRGSGTRNARIMLQVASQEHPELVRAYYKAVVEPRMRGLVRVLRDGVASGEVRADFDPVTAVPLLVGSMIFLRMWHPCDEIEQPSTDALIDALLRGLAA